MQLMGSARSGAEDVSLPLPIALPQNDTASTGARPPAGGANSDHVIAYRISLPVFGKRYYVAFFCGREGRSPQRIALEGQRKSKLHTSFSLTALFLLASTLLMSGMATAYLAKSMLGIDLFDDHFFLHNLFFD